MFAPEIPKEAGCEHAPVPPVELAFGRGFCEDQRQALLSLKELAQTRMSAAGVQVSDLRIAVDRHQKVRLGE